MKFDSSLRPQDKKTIAIVLYIAGIVLFGWYLIRPGVMKFIELDDKIRAAEFTKQENKMKTMQLGSAEILYDKAVTDITASSKNFYDLMDNSKIEKMGTSYVLGFGLTPVDFSVDIRDGSFVSEEPYAYSNIKKIEILETEEETTPVPTKIPDLKNPKAMAALDVKSLQAFYSQAIAGVTTTEPSEVQAAKITIVAQGTQEKCQALIDDILKKPSIRVTGFIWTKAKEIWTEDEKGNKTLMNPDYKELRLDLYFYMTEKPNFDKKEA